MITSAISTANSYIEQLKEGDTSTVSQADYLVIAHTDDETLGMLKNALRDNRLAMLTIPQNEWDLTGEPEEEAVQWAIENFNVKGVLLVGHSLGGFPKDEVQPESSVNQSRSLLDRVREAQTNALKSEKHFVNQLRCLQSLPSVARKALRDSSYIQGLFFRAESGTFCLFDSTTGSFRALIDDSHMG